MKAAWLLLLLPVFAGLLYECKRRLLFPMPMVGVYLLAPLPEQLRFLEQQLRCCRWLRQMGLLRGPVWIITDRLLPQQWKMLEILQRQELIDKLICWSELAENIWRTNDATGTAAGDRERSDVL